METAGGDASGSRRRVAVVGAGASGLAVLKELLDEGHEPTCFERARDPGGVFRFDERDGLVWESCRLTSSGLLTTFSDFPVPADRAAHITAGEYLEHLAAYREAFGLDAFIRLQTTVGRVARDGNGWRVVSTGPDGERRTEDFDAVAVCSGLHQHPHRPRFVGEETFRGRILHASEYRRPAEIAGKRVLVVGAGESGADLVAEIAAHAAETVLSLRRGVAVLPRRIHGYPNDHLTTRLANSPASWIFQTRHPDDDRKRRIYRWSFLPLVLLDKTVQVTVRGVRRLRLAGGGAVDVRAAQLTRSLLRESGGTLQEQFGTKSDDFVRAIAAGRARRVGAVTRFEPHGVVFDDGSRFSPELVVLCTGFEPRVAFLDDAIVHTPRYLHTFVPRVGASLAVIGFARPAFGAIPPLAELQARWFALLQSGEVQLPPADEMAAAAERQAAERRRSFRAVDGRLDELVDFTTLCDDLAAQIGCKPTRSHIGRERRAFRRRFYEGPFVAAQYRLVGPHARPELARRVIESLPIAQPRHEILALRMRWGLSRVLHRLLGPEFAPKLELAP